MALKQFQSLKYRDGLAKKRQRRFLARVVTIVIAGLTGVVALGWVVFFSGWFTIRDVSANGLLDSRKGQVLEIVQQQLGRRWLGLPIGNNIILFPSSHIESFLQASFPFIQTVNINKGFFHSLTIDVIERQPEGIWCFSDDCSYYDRNGILIAPAPRSSGFLMLTVNDMRQNLVRVIDLKFLTAIQTILSGLDSQGIKVKSITIPVGTFTEFDVATANGYPIKFSIDSDLVGQVHALEVYRKQHTDPNPPYQYLDLRFNGRVYYK